MKIVVDYCRIICHYVAGVPRLVLSANEGREAMAKCRKNNDGISYSGFQWDPKLMQAITEASRRQEANRAEVELVRQYLSRHPNEMIRLKTGQIRITAKSAPKILSGIIARARSENPQF
jgi:hypothetical protein